MNASSQGTEPTADWAVALQAVAQKQTLEAGRAVFHPGMACSHYLIVSAGCVRVFVSTASGREATLYRVEPGQTCVLTTSCLLSGDAYPAHAVTETNVEVQVVPATAFEELLDDSPAFRRFVFESLGRRLTTVIQRFEAHTDRAVLPRLARCLLEAGHGSDVVRLTHQQLATELGTAREVVSRHLKHLEDKGHLRLQRGVIELRDWQALAEIVDEPPV
ncbi:Crp/Fnr family transcriptional regulator [Wenzhouxiangella sp. EGI_FJ10409]|uniref:Crp/Fnr family transcriptional regulator n=1 Tax=Wenzhouxiangella sp. EGI_FJ10409 TaxID=3243767 RepID=UPI0035D840CE